jgi:hypothetical protein
MKFAILGGAIGVALALGLIFILSVTGVLEASGMVGSFFIGFGAGTLFINVGFVIGSAFDVY